MRDLRKKVIFEIIKVYNLWSRSGKRYTKPSLRFGLCILSPFLGLLLSSQTAKRTVFFKYIFIIMNEKENQFSEDYLRKLQEQFSESKRKEDIRKKRAEGGKKGGRPVVNKIRNIQKNIRLNEQEETQIFEIAQAYGISESELFRRSALNIPMPDPERNKLLSEYRTNFARISNIFRSEIWEWSEKEDFKNELKEVIQLLKNHLK